MGIGDAAGGLAAPTQWEAQSAAPAGATAQRFLSAGDASRVARARRDVVTEGTGRAVKGNPVPIAGKTGTAEVEGRGDTAWFASFAPADDPQFVVRAQFQLVL